MVEQSTILIRGKDMEDIKIVFTDLDGTLYRDDKTVSEFTIQTILKLREKGILFGIASGRDAFVIERMMPNHLMEQIDIIIGDNGFHIKDYKNHNDYYGTYMKKECIVDIYEKIKQFNYIGVFVEDNQYKAYVNGKMDLNEHNIISEYVNKEYLFNADISKFGIFVDLDDMVKVRDIFDTFSSEDYYAVLAGENIVDFQGYETNKINGLYRYLKEKNLSIDNVMYFGDSGNDYEMIKNIPHSISMINGEIEIKETASDITSFNNNEDGVARYLIEKFNL